MLERKSRSQSYISEFRSTYVSQKRSGEDSGQNGFHGSIQVRSIHGRLNCHSKGVVTLSGKGVEVLLAALACAAL